MRLKLLYLNFLLIPILQVSFAQELLLNNEVITNPQREYLFFESNLGDSILYYEGYSVIYSYEYNLPRYIFSKITPDQLADDSIHLVATRRNIYLPMILPNGSETATNLDYYKSGFDRGHMVPAGDYVWNQDLKDQTFTYANINPQSAEMNRGIWADLERSIRQKVESCKETAFVVTGVIFNDDSPITIGPTGLCVPVDFFKIVYFEGDSVMFSFLFDNTIEDFNGDLSQFQVSTDFIESITGEDFFDLIDDSKEEILESTIISFNDF